MVRRALQQPREVLVPDRASKSGADGVKRFDGPRLETLRSPDFATLENWSMTDVVREAVSDDVTAAVSAGLSKDEFEGLVRRMIYALAFDLVYLIDEPRGRFHSEPPAFDVGEDDPRWKLGEVGADGRPTGRSVLVLHESLMACDPEGAEARRWT